MSQLNTSRLQPGLCLLVEDQPQMNAFLQKAVEATFPGIQISGVRNLREATSWLDDDFHRQNLVFSLIDLGLPDGSGIDLIRLIAQVQPASLNIVITIFKEDAYLFEAIAAGAFGYLLKEDGPELMIDTLKRLHRHEPPISPFVARRLLAHFQAPRKEEPAKVELTPREKETLTLLVRGLTVPEAAAQMSLSAQTVSSYVKVIYQKMHVSNRAAAVREAMRRRMI